MVIEISHFFICKFVHKLHCGNSVECPFTEAILTFIFFYYEQIHKVDQNYSLNLFRER